MYLKKKGKNILSYCWHGLLIAFYLIDFFIFYFIDGSIWHHFLYYC